MVTEVTARGEPCSMCHGSTLTDCPAPELAPNCGMHLGRRCLNPDCVDGRVMVEKTPHIGQRCVDI